MEEAKTQLEKLSNSLLSHHIMDFVCTPVLWVDYFAGSNLLTDW
ncbi:hypothetical protein AB7340_20910 [Providencia alcalifaciens]